MGLDFYGTEISARIKVPYKKEGRVGGQVGFREFELWVNNSDSYLVPGALKDLAYVQDVTIQIGLGLNSKVSITLAPPLEEGLELIHSPLVNWAASELKVQIGYSTGDPSQRLSMEFGGLMMKPDVNIGQNISITLNALGVAYGMNLSSATSERTYPAGSSPWDAVRDTLSRHLNVELGTDSEIFPDFTPDQIDPSSPNAHPFFKPVTGKKISKTTGPTGSVQTEDEKLPINKGPRNDWWFVRELVAKYGLEIFVRDKSVVIRNPQKWRLDKPKYIFVLKGNIDTAAEVPIYPILSFNSPSAYVWLGEGSGGALIADVSPDAKQSVEKLLTTIKKEASDTTQAAASRPSALLTSENFVLSGVKKLTETVAISRTGSGAYNSSGGGPDAYRVFPGSPEDHRVEQVVGELRSYNNNRGIQAEVTTIGIPALLPADVVYLDGLSPQQIAHDEDKAWFSGKYGVMLVEHSIGTAGMLTKFKAIKNFFPKGMVASIERESEMGGQVNKSSIDDLISPNIGDKIKKVPRT